jgi:hypothetical protein
MFISVSATSACPPPRHCSSISRAFSYNYTICTSAICQFSYIITASCTWLGDAAAKRWRAAQPLARGRSGREFALDGRDRRAGRLYLASTYMCTRLDFAMTTDGCVNRRQFVQLLFFCPSATVCCSTPAPPTHCSFGSASRPAWAGTVSGSGRSPRLGTRTCRSAAGQADAGNVTRSGGGSGSSRPGSRESGPLPIRIQQGLGCV